MDNNQLQVTDDLSQMLGEIVKSLNRLFRKQFHRFAGGQELTVPQIFLLKHLVHHGPTSISELAGNLNLANSTVSGIVDRLERDGYVLRVRDAVDRRIVFVQLTEHGERLRQQVPEFQQRFLRDLIRDLPEQDLAQMLTSFRKLNGLIQTFEETNK